MNAAPTPCQVALAAFRWPDLSGWRGLPECKLEEFRQVFDGSVDDWRGAGQIGEAHRSLTWVNGTGGGFPNSIRAWLDGDRVVMLDTEILSGPKEGTALVAQLGTPAARLDCYFSNARIGQGESVYPARGLTLFVEPETGVLLRVAAYPKTSLANYQESFRLIGGRTLR